MRACNFRFFSLMLVILVSAMILRAGPPVAHSADKNKEKLDQLLNEKLSTLQTMVTQLEKLHELREVGNKDVYDARIAMHRAKLELCSTDDAKAPIFQEMLAEAKRREETIQQLPKSARFGVPEEAYALKLEQAKVDRLTIEIELERFIAK